MKFLKSILSEADGTGSTKRTAVMWTAIVLWTYIHYNVFGTQMMKDLRAQLMWYDFFFMLGGLGIISAEKILNKNTIPVKEDKPDTEVTLTTGSPGTSSLTAILLVALTACLITGCSRKVAITKSVEHSRIDSLVHTVDTTKTTATNTSTITSYYGGNLQGDLYVSPDTVVNAPVIYDSVEGGGIKLQIALVKEGSGYKAFYKVASTPVTTTQTTTSTATVDNGKTTDIKLTKQDDKTIKTKQVKAPQFGFGKFIIIAVIICAMLTLWYFFGGKVELFIGAIIHRIKGK